MRKLKIILTFGPASVAIDQVRRITNHSTGQLGNQLAEVILKKGHSLLAFRGSGALHASSFPFESFTTNQDLEKLLIQSGKSWNPDLILHAAALSDYTLDQIETSSGEELSSKISSQNQSLTLHLKQAPKILPQLRIWFPQAKIVGWKYELNGTKNEVIQKGIDQIQKNKTDLCVLNGDAYGEGFGICSHQGILHSHLSAQSLAERLLF